MTIQDKYFGLNTTLVTSIPAKLACDFGYGQRLSFYSPFFKRALDFLFVVLERRPSNLQRTQQP